jgi:nucleolar protein 58
LVGVLKTEIDFLGIRTKAATTDLSEEVPDDVESEIKKAAELSMGTEITEQDE